MRPGDWRNFFKYWPKIRVASALNGAGLLARHLPTVGLNDARGGGRDTRTSCHSLTMTGLLQRFEKVQEVAKPRYFYDGYGVNQPAKLDQYIFSIYINV